MTDPAAPPQWPGQPYPAVPPTPPPTSPPPTPPPASERAAQLRSAGLVVAVLAVVGALLGVLWQAWSPPGPAGVKLPAGIQADETEAFAAGDGRFALIVAVVGLLAGFAAWYVPRLRATRGPYVALGLAVGGIVGAVLTELVGWLLRGQGSNYTCGNGSLTCVDHLPLTVHMHALLFIEAVVALLVYILFVAFAVADDLGRPDPNVAARAVVPPPPVATSVGPQGGLQHPWRDGDGAGAPQ